jgi:hypothetical protein
MKIKNTGKRITKDAFPDKDAFIGDKIYTLDGMDVIWDGSQQHGLYYRYVDPKWGSISELHSVTMSIEDWERVVALQEGTEIDIREPQSRTH